MKVAIRTIGCRANQADSAALGRALDPGRIRLVSELEQADLILINTCCVTAEAERDCRKVARRALRAAPDARVVLTGCAVSAVPDLIEALGDELEARGGGAQEPEHLAQWINDLARGDGSAGEKAATESIPATRTRALLKVQNGCSHGCAYCIVPRARGPERSLPVPLVLERVDELRDAGHRELVLTGVQLGAWGCDLPGAPRLPELVRAVADRFAPGRVRLSSVEPWSVGAELIDVIAGHERVCPHLHVPVQSGDDRVLGAMGRGYSAREFLQLGESAKGRIDGLALGTDVLCGFPGEDAAAFGATLGLLEEVAPAYVHAFPFSPRAGTRAAELVQEPSREVARDRVREVRGRGERAADHFRRGQDGTTREIIVERIAGDLAHGRTDNYLQVELPADGRRAGELLRVRLSVTTDGGRLRGEPE